MKTLHTLDFSIYREEANFDRACDSARNYALTFLNVDEDGDITAVKDSCRSTDYIKIDFISFFMSGSMGGWRYTYNFKCSVLRED